MRCITCFCLLLLAALSGRTQMIDTVLDPWVTANDSVNKRITALSGFGVEVIEPEVITRRGIAIRNGFDKYYIFVIASEQVLIEGQPMEVEGEVYLAVCSTEKKLKLEDETFAGRVLFLKGIVVSEDLQAKVEEWNAKAEQLLSQADSIEAVVDSAFMPEPEFLKEAEDMRFFAEEAVITAGAYEMLARNRRGKGLIKFFLSHYFARSRTFSIWTHPYGLLQYKREKELVPLEDRRDQGETPYYNYQRLRTNTY